MRLTDHQRQLRAANSDLQRRGESTRELPLVTIVSEIQKVKLAASAKAGSQPEAAEKTWSWSMDRYPLAYLRHLNR